MYTLFGGVICKYLLFTGSGRTREWLCKSETNQESDDFVIDQKMQFDALIPVEGD